MGLLSNKIAREELKPGDHIYSWRQAYIYAHHGIYICGDFVIHFTRGAKQNTGTGTVLDHLLVSSSPPSNTDNPCRICGDQSRLDGVILTCLDCFLFGGELCLFEYGVSPPYFLANARGGTCTLASSDRPEDVIDRASFLLANGFGGYNVFKNNCEDFAIYCKTALLVESSISGWIKQASPYVDAARAVASSPLCKAVDSSRLCRAVASSRLCRAVTSSPLFRAVASSPFCFLTTSFSGLALVGFGTTYCVGRLVSDIGVRRDVSKVPVEELFGHFGLEEPVKTAKGTKED